MDSVYTPVKKVNYTVENTRVGDRTDFDKLTLEVWTNGTIDAQRRGQPGRPDPGGPSFLNLFTDLSRDHGLRIHRGGEG